MTVNKLIDQNEITNEKKTVITKEDEENVLNEQKNLANIQSEKTKQKDMQNFKAESLKEQLGDSGNSNDKDINENKDRLKFTKEEIKELLNKGKVYESLKAKQILKVILWSTFNDKKMIVFLNGLKNGKAAYFAYQDALKHK